jgi:thioesterase domain-containing protein
VRYIPPVAFEAVLQEALRMSAEERAELIEHLIDRLDDNEVEPSAEALAELDDALVDAERAAERGELIPRDEVLVHMRETS